MQILEEAKGGLSKLEWKRISLSPSLPLDLELRFHSGFRQVTLMGHRRPY